MAGLSGGVRIENLRRVIKDLQTLGVEVDDLKEAFGSIASEAAEKAAQFAPKRTGRLAASVRGNKAKSKAVVTAGRARVPYAGAINYGWRKRGISPSEFMQRADAAMQDRAVQLLEDSINRAMSRRGLS